MNRKYWFICILMLSLLPACSICAEDLFCSGDGGTAAESPTSEDGSGMASESVSSGDGSGMVLNSEPFGAASAPVASFESGEPLSPENIAEALEDFTDISSPDQVDNVPELISGESPESYIQLPSWSETEVNPLYADVFTPDDLRSMVPAKDSDAATEASESVGAGISWYSDEKSAVADLRDHMVNRDSSIQIGYRSKTEIDAAFVNRISGLAMEHTGKPKEGDSLYSCWQGMNYGVSDYRKEG
ncbi:MAG: hypothetical protein IKE03_02185, partial [Blautia sp.]|nr:hypothetical protein [Blautia sp.]